MADAFDLLDDFTVPIPGGLSVPVRVHVNKASGLRVVFADVEGPLAQVAIVVPTCVSDDSGLPHTLEHLCFMGSKGYPHRGFLDTAALLSISVGTNAWTDCDHTCYTVSTAGMEGLLTILPVFLDHVLCPTLSAASFTTEVYHVDGKAREQGVVMCEMMAREYTESDRSDLATRRALYSSQATYAWECGGLTKDIRKLTIDRIRAYHRKWYAAGNVTVVVFGHGTDDRAVLASVMQSPAMQPGAQPLVDTPKSNATDVGAHLAPGMTTNVVPFPDEDEEMGSITLAWPGPELHPSSNKLAADSDEAETTETLVALDLLARYLTEGSASPLHQALVECSDAAGSDVDIDLRMHARTALFLTVSGMHYRGRADHTPGANGDADESGWSDEDSSSSSSGAEHSESESDDDDSDSEEDELEADGPGEEEEEHLSGTDWFARGALLDRVRATLQEQLDPESSTTAMTLDGIHRALHRHTIALQSQLEDDPHDAMLGSWLPDLVSPRRPLLSRHRSTFDIVDDLRTRPITYWQQLLRKWILDAPAGVQTMAVPSAKLAESVQDEKEKRTARIRKKLGARGLKEAQARLEAAMRANAVRVDTFRADLPSPADPRKIEPLGFKDEVVKFTPAESPFPQVQFVMVPTSQFVHVKLFFALPRGADLPESLAALLVLVQELVFQQATADGTPYATLISNLQASTTQYSCSVGLGSDVFSASYMTEMVAVQYTCLASRASDAAQWIVRALATPVFELDRLATVTKNLLADVADWRRDGGYVLGATSSTLIGNAAGLVDPWLGVPVQYHVLKGISRQIRQGSVDSILVRLRSVHELMFATPLFAQVTANSRAVADTVLGTVNIELARYPDGFVGRGTKGPPVPFPFPRSPYRRSEGDAAVIPVKGISASFCSIWVDFDLLSTPQQHPDYYSTLIALDLLSRSEGPLFTAIRGPGLAYDASVHAALWTGTLSFDASEASDPVGCVRAFYRVLDETVQNPATSTDPLAVAVAKAAIVYRHAAARSTPACIASEAFRARLRGTRDLAARDIDFAAGIASCTEDQVAQALVKVAAAFRDTPRTRTVMVVPDNSDAVAAIAAGVTAAGLGNAKIVRFDQVLEQVVGIPEATWQKVVKEAVAT
ncbi:hypothetical protein BC828DRAFT_379462 [Blastocladiella britannica]|nr:hypothetical protein BC828DRAFT_379462 [Blastocladiella britannica]